MMSNFHPILTSLTCSLGSFVAAMLSVWPSYTLAKYTSQNGTILSSPMTEFEVSLLGSIPSIGAMVGTAVAVPVIERYGRKWGAAVLTLPYAVSWGVIYVSSSTLPILTARFFGGTSAGALLVLSPVFIMETAEDSIRGALASGPMTLYCIGVLCSYVVGYLFDYYAVIWINIACSVVNVLLFTFVVESPVYLLKQHREQDAQYALAKYRGESPMSKIVEVEMYRLKQQILPVMQIISTVDPDLDVAEKGTQFNQTEPSRLPPWKFLFISAASRQALLVVGVTLTLQIFMGMTSVQVYAEDLFQSAVSGVSSSLCSILSAVVLLGGTLISTFVSDILGRRVLIVWSSALVFVCMLVGAVALQTEATPSWVMAIVLLLYCFFFNIGAGTMPYVLMSELFTVDVQDIASMILVELVGFLNFLAIMVTPYLKKSVGVHGLFYIFTISAAINTVASYMLVPETKGLSTDKIQEALVRNNKTVK